MENKYLDLSVENLKLILIRLNKEKKLDMRKKRYLQLIKF